MVGPASAKPYKARVNVGSFLLVYSVGFQLVLCKSEESQAARCLSHAVVENSTIANQFPGLWQVGARVALIGPNEGPVQLLSGSQVIVTDWSLYNKVGQQFARR